MTSIKLDASQYSSYDMDGDILATRAVKVHTLSALSEQGPGICATLRTGEEIEAGDGIGVSLTITNKQLEALGFITNYDDAGEIVPDSQDPDGGPDGCDCGSCLDVAVEFGPGEDYEGRESEPVKYAFCLTCEIMVDPEEEQLGEIQHDRVEVFCTNFGWVEAGEAAGSGPDDYMRHAFYEDCIDKSGLNLPARP